MGVKSPYEFIKAWEPFDLLGLQKHIECPVLCLVGEDELEQTSQSLIDATMKWVQEGSNVQNYLFSKDSGASAHSQIGNMN